MMDLKQEAQEVAEISSRLSHLEQSLEEDEARVKGAVARITQTQKAQEILQLLAQAVQQKAHQKISEVVTSCLEAVFGADAYEFKIEFERKRGKTEARLRFVRGGLCVDPLTASGGGVVDVAAFALRISCLVLHRPRLSRVVVLDEPFRFVSEQYQENVRQMLEQLSEEMGVQIIFVTHNDALATGKLVTV